MVRRRALRTFVLMAALSAAASAYAQDASVVPAPGQPDAPPAAAERPGTITRLRTWASDIQLMGRLNGDVDGWYPRIGGVTRGSGFAFGPGVRMPLFGNALFLDMSGAISLKGYSALDARLRWLQVLDQRIELWTDLRFEDFPEEDFFGVGMDSAQRFAPQWHMFDDGRLNPGHFHSTPMNLVVERGLPALLLWLFILAAYARALWKGLRSDNPKSKGILLGCLGGMVGFFASGLVHYNLGDQEVAMMFFLLMGIAVKSVESIESFEIIR